MCYPLQDWNVLVCDGEVSTMLPLLILDVMLCEWLSWECVCVVL